MRSRAQSSAWHPAKPIAPLPKTRSITEKGGGWGGGAGSGARSRVVAVAACQNVAKA